MPQFWNEGALTWISLGIFSIFAVVTARSQLTTFKKRCEIRTEAKRDTINQETEDGAKCSNISPSGKVIANILASTESALKLESLAVLARSVNFDLRNAALKILGERATTGDKYDYILKQLYSPEPETRLKSLKVLIYLATSAPIEPFARLCNSKTFNALISALLASINEPPTQRTEREVFRILSRLMQFNRDLAIQGGIIEWFKRRPEVVPAYFEPTKFEKLDVNLIVIIALLLHDARDGKSVLEKENLLPERAIRDNLQSRAWQQHHAILAAHEISRGVNRVPPAALSVFL